MIADTSPGMVPLELFTAAARRTRLAPHNIKAAELVLCRGVRLSEAARQAGIKHRQHVRTAVQTIREVLTEGDQCKACGQALNKPTGALAP